MRHDTRLVYGLESLLGGHPDGQARGHNPPSVLGVPADGLRRVGEEVPPLLGEVRGEVRGELGMAQELLRVFLPGATSGELAGPGEADLLQDPLGYFRRKGAILFSGLHEGVEDVVAAEGVVLARGLAGEIERRIVEILTGKRR